MSVLLIHPPGARSCEPYSSVGRLSGLLNAHGVACTVWDASAECTRALLTQASSDQDTFSRRATKTATATVALLQSRRGYANLDRYRNAVKSLNRALSTIPHAEISLSDYRDPVLNPLESSDLSRAAARWADSPYAPLFVPRLNVMLEETHAETVGFSLSYLSQALPAFAMIGFVRERYPHLKIVLGGGLLISWVSQRGWRNPWPDLVHVAHGGDAAAFLKDHLGIAPEPGLRAAHDYGFVKSGDYIAPGLVLPVSASGGCWWGKCSFCPEAYECAPYRPVPPGLVVRELARLARDHRPLLFHITDNEVSPALCRAIIEAPPGVAWYGFSRFFDELKDPGFCEALARSGCVMLQLGLESGDPRVLRQLNKGIDLDVVTAVLTNLRRAGIATYIYLLFGTPAETREAAERTLRFCAARGELMDFFNLALFNLPMESPEAQQLESAGKFSADLSLYKDFEHPTGWHRGEIRRFLDEHFRAHPALRDAVLRTPPTYTSNHAPFLAHLAGKRTPFDVTERMK